MLAALEGAVNRYLRLDPDALRHMAELDGKVLAIELRGINLTLYLLPGPDGVRVRDVHSGAPDARLRGTPLALARLGMGGKAPGALFAGEVEISGDTELGQRFKAILDAVDIDWEEPLSRAIGDVAAHQAGNAVRAALAFGERTRTSLCRDLTDYLQEESRVLPTRAELEEWLARVDALRSDGDRLEARVKRLRERRRDAS